MSFSSLDLSWNCFDAEDFQQMGKQLMQTKPGPLGEVSTATD